MRLRATDQGAAGATVTVDGEPQVYCFAADDVEGWADVYECGPGGKPLVGPNGALQPMRIYGTTVIVLQGAP